MTNEQQVAFNEVRKAMIERLKNFEFTEEMLKELSLFQMLNLLELLLGHRNYIGMFSHTVFSLQDVFGDAVWDKPKAEPKPEPTDEEMKAVVH
jgi:hypothetical protein